jgi:hypothetical protein
MIRTLVTLVAVTLTGFQPAPGNAPLPQDSTLVKSERFGFSFRAPKSWTSVALKTDEAWLASKHLSNKEYFGTDKTTAVGCYQYAKIVRSSDKNLARDLYRQATELAPLTGTYWYEYGRLHTDEDEGKRLKALGMELDPEVGAYDIDFEDTDD